MADTAPLSSTFINRHLEHRVTMVLPGACAYSPALRPMIEEKLGPTGIDIERFCVAFDDKTAAAELFNFPVGVWIHVYNDKSFAFEFTHSQLLGCPVSFRLRDIYSLSLPPPCPRI